MSRKFSWLPWTAVSGADYKHEIGTDSPVQVRTGRNQDSEQGLVAVQSLSHVWLFVTHGLPHSMPPCPLPSPRVCSNPCSLRWWCHPTISSSTVPFSSCLLSFPASGSFLMSQFFTSGGQSIGASVSVLLMNIQDWFPLELTGLISLQTETVWPGKPSIHGPSGPHRKVGWLLF